MKKSSHSLKLKTDDLPFCSLPGLSAVSSQSSPPKVPVPELAARVGYSANFSCESFGVPISVCLWERMGENKKLINFPIGTTPGYSLAGSLEKGICGLTISVVSEADNAVWDCKLITNAGIYQGSVRVGILSE
jgi:hypothetical protein